MIQKKVILSLSIFTLVFLSLAIVSAECIDTCKSNNVYVDPSYQGTVNVCSYDKMGTHYSFGCKQGITTSYVMEYYNPYGAPSRYFWDIRCNNFNTPWCWVRNHNCGVVSGTAENWNICTSPINDLGDWHNGVNQGTCNSCAAENETNEINNAPIISALTATPTNQSAIISWLTDINSTSLVNYGLTSSLGTTISSSALTLLHSAILNNLQNSTTYYYKVTSCNSQNNCTSSNIYSFVTLANPQIPPIDTTAPIISNLNVQKTNTTASISWNTNEGANSTINFGLTTSLGTLISNSNFLLNQIFNLTNLQSNTTYYFNITSCDSSGNCNTQSSSFTTLSNAAAQVPNSVSNLHLVSSANSSLTWDWTNPVTNFNGTFISISGTGINNLFLASPINSYTALNLNPNSTYTITIHTLGLNSIINNTDVSNTAATLANQVIPPIIPPVNPPSEPSHNKKTTKIFSSASEEQVVPQPIIHGQSIGNLTVTSLQDNTTKTGSSLLALLILLFLLILLLIIIIILALVSRRR
jgi:hypothetical protein